MYLYDICNNNKYIIVCYVYVCFWNGEVEIKFYCEICILKVY